MWRRKQRDIKLTFEEWMARTWTVSGWRLYIRILRSWQTWKRSRYEIDKATAQSILAFWAISDRVMLVKLKRQPFDTAVIQACAPTSDADDDDIETFYDNLDATKAQWKSQEVIVMLEYLNERKDRRGQRWRHRWSARTLHAQWTRKYNAFLV